jgi:hypothetical protein
LPVVTDEELGDRRGLVIKQVLGRLSDPRPFAKNDQTFVLARIIRRLCP